MVWGVQSGCLTMDQLVVSCTSSWCSPEGSITTEVSYTSSRNHEVMSYMIRRSKAVSPTLGKFRSRREVVILGLGREFRIHIYSKTDIIIVIVPI